MTNKSFLVNVDILNRTDILGIYTVLVSRGMGKERTETLFMTDEHKAQRKVGVKYRLLGEWGGYIPFQKLN